MLDANAQVASLVMISKHDLEPVLRLVNPEVQAIQSGTIFPHGRLKVVRDKDYPRITDIAAALD